MNWFDVTESADLDLLHSSIRNDDELLNAVTRAQLDIFTAYREGGVVKLSGYDADVELADAELVTVVKNTIADIVSFRLRSYNNEYGVESIQQGQRSITFRDSGYWDAMPKRWNSLLTDFDTREALYYV